MFDGSHRTNKREINYAGASASSKSSRKTNLNVARQQRLQRAQAKAKLNSAKRLQRCWRGSSCRRSVAEELSGQYQSLMATSEQHQNLSKATSLLAFRMSTALIPFYSSSNQTAKKCSNTKATRKNWGENDIIAETSMRKDLVLLSNMIQGNNSEQQQVQISSIASQKIVDITLILLRQSINHTTATTNKQEINKENQSLVQLLGYLLESSFLNNTDETVDNLTSWMINVFLLFRDYTFAYNDDHNDKETTDISSQLLKWCCQIVIRLVQPKDTEDMNMQEEKNTLPLTYQQGLALLASILFASSNFEENQVVKEQLNSCLLQCVKGHVGEIKDMPTTFSLLTHYLATSMSAISATTPKRNTSDGSRKVPGLMTSFQTSSTSSSPLLDALRDTLSSREFIVMNQILSIANTQKQTNESRELMTYAIPIILQYTLQQQSDLAVLSSFAAQGQNITSWFTESANNQPTTSIATAAAAAAFEGEDVEDESDDDEQDAIPAQQQHQSSSRDNKTSSGRYSRTDLQTLPKLDTFYQTNTLQAKKVTVDRLRSLMASHGKQVTILISLAEKIGRGDWIQQLGSSLFSSTDSHQSLSSLLVLLAPTSLSSWQKQAQKAYTSALATVMTTCSGIKAGRNAASPLLSKLAFNETFVYGMWERTRQSMSLLVSQSKNIDLSAVTSACEMCSSFCDTFAHTLLAVDDDDFLRRYYQSDDSKASGQNNKVMNAKDIVLVLKTILNDLYWVRPVLASDITNVQSDPESTLRFQRARLLLAGTKLFNSLNERWCRLYRVVQFCSEDCWWFPQLASRGQHDNNPIISAQETTLQNDDMDDSSVESDRMMEDDEADPMSANDAGGDALASAFKDAKMARVLTFIPMAMPFSRRVNLFNSLLESDKARTQDESASFRQMMMNFEDGEEGEMSSREKVTIRRDALYSDSKRRLNNLGKRLRKRVQVTFVNKHGQEEAGIDGGGVFKEFLDDLITDGFLPENDKGDEDDDDDSVVETHPDFFVVTPLQTLKVNTSLDGNDSMLSHYEFLGRVLGKAIYGKVVFMHSSLYYSSTISQYNFSLIPTRINTCGASVLSSISKQAPGQAE